MSVRRTKFYLDKQGAKFWGVCSGIADYTGIDAVWVRVGFVLATFFGGPFAPIAYAVIAWVGETKPYALYDDDADTRKFWQKTRAAPSRSIRDTNASYRDADRRLRDIEAYVTSGNRNLAAEIDRLK
jgi:phage shock protein C